MGHRDVINTNNWADPIFSGVIRPCRNHCGTRKPVGLLAIGIIMAKQAANTPATKAARKAAPVAAAAAPVVATPAPVAVALRGGPAVQAVKLTGKAYRSAAKHNTDWWAAVTKANGGPVADLVKAGVPTHFIGYTMRRGYLQAV